MNGKYIVRVNNHNNPRFSNNAKVETAISTPQRNVWSYRTKPSFGPSGCFSYTPSLSPERIEKPKYSGGSMTCKSAPLCATASVQRSNEIRQQNTQSLTPKKWCYCTTPTQPEIYYDTTPIRPHTMFEEIHRSKKIVEAHLPGRSLWSYNNRPDPRMLQSRDDSYLIPRAAEQTDRWIVMFEHMNAKGNASVVRSTSAGASGRQQVRSSTPRTAR
jgi:hypothetical protein